MIDMSYRNTTTVNGDCNYGYFIKEKVVLSCIYKC